MSFTVLFRRKGQDADQKILEAGELFRSQVRDALENIFIERLHSVTPEYMSRYGRIYRLDVQPAATARAEQLELLEQSLLMRLMAIGLERGFVPMNEDGEAIYDPACLGLDQGDLLSDQRYGGADAGSLRLLTCQGQDGGALVVAVSASPVSGSEMGRLAHRAYLELLLRASRDGLDSLGFTLRGAGGTAGPERDA